MVRSRGPPKSEANVLILKPEPQPRSVSSNHLALDLEPKVRYWPDCPVISPIANRLFQDQVLSTELD